MTKTLMVMAGGTGGHVYPAMAVADVLKDKGWHIVWLCTEGGMENRLIANKNYQKAMMTMRGVRGKGLLGWLLLPVKLAVAFKQAFQAIKQFQPNLVLGMGGFAAFPGGIMAWCLRKPLVIHEQNSVAGLTNKTLALFADQVLAAFPNAFPKNALGFIKNLDGRAALVGNPVRADITQVVSPEIRFKNRTGTLRILVVGGSLGAQALNTVLPKALARLNEIKLSEAQFYEKQLPEVIHQAGEKHIEILTANYKQAKVQAKTVAFIEDMAAMYAWADIVICRAGALTIAELSAAGVASVLVPFPFAVDDHQTTNAHYLSQNGAAILIPQTDFTVEKVVQILHSLTREQCINMAIQARQLGKPQAAIEVANICEALAL